MVEGSFKDTERQPFTGADIRYTTQGDTLYAILLGWPNAAAHLPALGSGAGLYDHSIGSVELLGHAGSLTWQQFAGGLHVELPSQRPCDHAYVLKITPA